MIGFGRIGQLVAHRAQSFEMQVVAYDKFVAAERFRERGVERAETTDDLYAKADIVTIHLPKTPDTVNWIDAEAIAKMKDGVRIVNCARGELIDLEALEAGLDSGKVGGAALDVFPAEPVTDLSLFERDNVVVTPHLGAATAEAQDRAGTITADQVRRALSGGVVTNAVNIAAVRPEEMEALAPFVPLCEKLGRLAQGLGNGSVDRISAEFRGRIADHDTRLLGIAVLVGILSGHTEEQVNLVNAPTLAEERGIELTELKDTVSDEFTELVTVRIESGDEAVEVAGTAVGPRNLPHLVRVWGESFYMPFADHLVVFRYKDEPGMIGRIGTIFGRAWRQHRLGRCRGRGVGRSGRAGADDRRARPRGGARGDHASWRAFTPAARSTCDPPDRWIGSGAYARGGDHTARPAGGPSGPGAPGPAGRARRGQDRRQGRGDQLRRHAGPDRPLPGRAQASPASSATRSPARSSPWGRGWTRTRSATGWSRGTRFNGQAELVTVPAEQASAAAQEALVRGGRGVSRQLRAPRTRRW